MTGLSSGDLMIAVCDRCHVKMPYTKLQPDGNSPGLRVCRACSDDKDPYRLPARQTEAVSVQTPRPDSGIAISSNYLLASPESYIITGAGSYIKVSG
jgi:hypothetical protein